MAKAFGRIATISRSGQQQLGLKIIF